MKLSDAEYLQLQAEAARVGMTVQEYLVHARWAALPWGAQKKPRRRRGAPAP